MRDCKKAVSLLSLVNKMKKTICYDVNNKKVQRDIEYIPLRYILAILITAFEVLAVIGIVVDLCYYVPYFYLAAWATEIFCVIRIIASDDNPDYKVPWLLFVLIIPIAGFMLYFMFYSRTLQKRFVRRLNALKSNSYKKNDDDDYAMIGTINLDYRSLVHHFENGVWMYKCESVSALKEDIEKTLNDSIEVTPNMLKTNLFQKFIRAVVRIFAPML